MKLVLHKFISEYNGFNRIGGGQLYELFSTNKILHQGSIDEVVALLKMGSLQDAYLLVDPSSEDSTYVKRILWMAWFALKIEEKMEDNEDLKQLLMVDEDDDEDEDDEDILEDEDEEDDEDEDE